jgi:hypothetical protein
LKIREIDYRPAPQRGVHVVAPGPLIALLSEGSAGAWDKAALALENLTFDAGNRAEAAKPGYVRPS